MTEGTRDRTSDRAEGPVGGERLAEARRLKKISLPDIARELHLDEAKVQALEENRFDVLGAPVFAKGHLRKYAEVVGVPLDDILADYYTMNRKAGAPPVVAPPHDVRRDINLAPWLLGIPLLLIALGIAWWWLGRAPAPSVPAANGDSSAAAEIRQGPAVSPPPADAEALGELPVDDESAGDEPEAEASGESPDGTAAAESREPVASAVAESAPGADNAAAPASLPLTGPTGEVRLALSYSGDCWTEIADSSGRRLYFDLARAGQTVNVSGSAPLSVLLGDTGNVTLSVNGEPYAIPESQRQGDTARLTIGR